jgi:hypothetical protein
LDAVLDGRRGAELSLWLKHARARIQAQVQEFARQLGVPVANGQPVPAVRKSP